MRLFTIAALFVAAAGCGNRESNTNVSASTAPAQRARVAMVRIEPQVFEATVPVTGSLVSRTQVDVKAETTGRVLRFTKQEGEEVNAGEALVWVNPEDHTLAVRQAEAALKVAEAAQERARINAEHTRNELERARNLVASGGITDRDLKAAQLAEVDARAQVQLAQAQADQARAVLATSSKRLRDTVIYAPVRGEIQRRMVNPGAYVEPPTAVFTLVDNGRLELEAPVPASEMGSIRIGQSVRFHVNSFPGSVFQARVIEANPSVDANSRSVKVRIAVDNSQRKLKAGMFAEGAILTDTNSRAIVIPSSAVYRDDRSAKKSYVFIAADGKAARRDITIGRERDNLLEITDGLRPGDMLITEQSIEIADGVAVEPRR